MFAKRHYEFIAKTFREYPFAVSQLDLNLVASGLADRFERDNPRFDRQRFLAACKRA
jgi:hypothetical protein